MCSDPCCPLFLRWFLRGKQCLCLEFYFSSHCSVSTKDKLALTFPGFLLLTWSQLGALVANWEPWGWASGESYCLDSLETSNSVQFSCSIMSDSLWPYELQHASLPCLSPTPGVCSNSWPLSQWCHLIISSSVIPFSCLQSLPALGSFQMSQFFTSGGQRDSASAQDWFPLGATWSPCSPRDSQEASPTPQFKSINSLVLSFLYGNIHRSIFSLETYTDLYFP